MKAKVHYRVVPNKLWEPSYGLCGVKAKPTKGGGWIGPWLTSNIRKVTCTKCREKRRKQRGRKTKARK